jgi:fibronectin type 3 domain-containing protein
MRKTRLNLVFLYVLILSPVISLFLFPLADVSAAALSKLQVSSLSDTPDPFSPNNDGRLDVVTITSALNIEGTGQTAQAVLKSELAVKDGSGKQVASLEVGKQLRLDIGKWNATAISTEWSGKTSNGALAADGTYFYTVDLSLLKGCKGNGDNRDDLHSGHVDLLGDCNSGEGNDTKDKRIIATSGPFSGAITLDNTPPSIIVEGVSNGELSNKDLTPVISISDQHMASQSIFLNNKPFLSSTPVTEEGHYALSIIAEDRAVNAAKIDLEFTIDKTPPTVIIISPASGSQIDTSNPQISLEYSDSVSGIDVSTVTLTVDNMDISPDAHITETGITYLPLTSLQEGAHTVGISVSDKAGNIAVQTTTFTIRSRCQSINLVPTDTTENPFIFPEPSFDITNNNIEVADVNRDGYLDIVGASSISDSGGNYKSKISVLLGKQNGGHEKHESFAERQSSSSVSNVVLGHFNNDCYPDIVVTGFWAHEFSIFINNGDGSFTEKSVYGIDDRSTLLTGRFDGDGYEDIVVYNSTGKVSIFRGNGDGTFAAPANLTINSGYSDTVDMTVLDLNEDGITDIIAVMGDSSLGREIVLLTGLHQGDFTQSHLYTVSDNDNGSIRTIVAGDFNGDGHVDIVIARQADYDGISRSVDINLTTFLGDGSGWLSGGRDNVLWAENLYSWGDYYGYNCATMRVDINGDRNDDIVINVYGKIYAYVSNGDGSFHYSNAYNVNNSNRVEINSGDFDSDGDEDIITPGGFVLANRGDGTFIDWKHILQTGYLSASVASADFDGDKRPDLVTTAGETWQSQGRLFSTILNRNDDWSEEPFQSSHSTSYNIVGGPRSLKTGDLDRDGHLDVVTANKAPGTIAVLINNSDGSLKAPVYYQTGQKPDHVVLEDLNGDNHLDIITANEGSGDVSILLGKGNGTFQEQKTYAAGSMPGGLAVGDFDRDGKPDLAVTNSGWGTNEVSILFGKGDGTFGDRVINTVNGTMSSTIKEGDFNNDGIVDLAVLYRSGSGWWGIDTAIDILLGKGDGTFPTKFAVGGGGQIYDFISDDFNKDGTLDIVIFDTNSDSASILTNDGNGRFTRNQLIGQSVTWPAVSGDIDNDGETDLLLQGVGSLTPWFGQGNGTLERGVSIGGSYAMALDLGDIDGDGIMDIVAVEDGLKLLIILGTGGGSFQGEAIVSGSEQLYAGVNLTTGDFNGDGNQDIAVSLSPSDGEWPTGNVRIVLYWGSGYNTFTKGTVIETDNYFEANIFAADLNGDGKMDIMLQAHPWDNNEVSVFLNKGGGNFQGALKYDIGSSGYLKLEDINGDGYPDIITDVEENMSWGISSYGVSIHAGNGDGTFRHLYTLPFGERQSGLSLNSQLGDLNNDGYPDLVGLSHDSFAAEHKIYLNNGGGFDADAAYETTIPDGRFAGDFNNDGNIDLVITTDEDLSLSLGKEDGTFSPAVRYATGSYTLGGHEYVVRDFNLDGRPDIAVPSFSGLHLLYNTLPPLLTPPSPPTALKGLAEDATVTLSWAKNSEDDVEGYNVYRSLSAGGGYQKINGAPLASLAYTDDNVTNGVTYYYTVAALDEGGEESSYAVKVRATPHAPDTTPPIVNFRSPVNNQTVTNPALFASGTINETDAKVTINGMPATIQKNSGTFTAYGIPLNIGENIITVTAVDRAGNTASSAIKVIYVRTAMIEGVTKDELTGSAVPNAWVYVRDIEKEQVFATKPDGTFTFLNVIPGEITITVYGNVYDIVTIDRTVAPGENLVLDIALPLYPATIDGRLLDANTSNYLSNATITITDRKKTQTLTANDYGHFESFNVTPYQVTITLASAGYATHTETINVTNRWSNYLYFYLDPLPPSLPSGFTATPGKGFVNLAWNANSESNLATYQIYRSTTSGGGYQLIASTASDAHSYADGDVVTGTAYYYVVQAVNTSAQPSGYSAEVAAMPEALPAPAGLAATPGKQVVNLAWEAIAESHISSYNIYRAAEAGGDFALIGSVAAPTVSYADSQVDAGVTYTYVVTAVNAWAREGGRSNAASAVPEVMKVNVAITSPYNGAYSPTATVLVRGTVESGDSPEVGVVLVVESGGKEGVISSTYLAEVNNGSFAAQISLFPGIQNTLRAIATLPEGEQAIAAITLYADAAEAAVKLNALPANGILSAQTRTFDASFKAEVNIAGTITGYSWDFDGDGSIEQVTNTPAATFGYTRPGIYYPVVTVTVDAGSDGGVPPKGGEKGPSGMGYSATTIVNVMSREGMDAIIQNKWQEMTNALTSGNIDQALTHFVDGQNSKYKEIFWKLKSQLSAIFKSDEEFSLVYASDNRIEYESIVVEGDKAYSYPVIFVKDVDGLWKLSQF